MVRSKQNCHVSCSIIGNCHISCRYNYWYSPSGTIQPCSHLDLIVPNMKGNIRQQHQKQKIKHDVCSRIHTFKQGDSVLVHNFGSRFPGIITELLATNSYWTVPRLFNDMPITSLLDNLIVSFQHLTLILLMFSLFQSTYPSLTNKLSTSLSVPNLGM